MKNLKKYMAEKKWMFCELLFGMAMGLAVIFTGTTAVYAEETSSEEALVSEERVVPHYNFDSATERWDGTHYYKADGTMATQCFFCDGTYTYYLQNDGTPMCDRLTYHPDGEHIIYFDGEGHEVFSNFANVKQSIAGDGVEDLCFFDVYGFMYVDVVTYDEAGENLYYANPYGVMERSGWFTFSANQGGGIGYANADGTLMKDTYTYDTTGNAVYLQANGRVAGTGTATGISIPAVSTESKKGIQGMDNGLCTDVTVKHIVENVYLDALITSNTEERNHYDYNGNRYYFTTYAETLMRKVEEANEKGIKLTFILLMRGNDYCASEGMMYAGAGATDSTRLYALNPNSEAVHAVMNYMAQTYIKDRRVDNWIVGNEVNMPDAYNYTGTLDLTTNADVAAGNFLALYNAIANTGVSGIREYVNIDHSWTDNDGGRGIAGKYFLNQFAAAIEAAQSGTQWNVAYHLYAPLMSDTASIWTRSDLAASDENAKFICASNLSVLTDYIKTHFGSNCRVILSEQGFDVNDGASVQAAALAYTFYAAQYNDMVDAVMFRSYRDEGTDGILDLGLKDSNGNAREAFNVFQYMDTSVGHAATDGYLGVIGASGWQSIIPNYTGMW